jgi:hypothetical protein
MDLQNFGGGIGLEKAAAACGQKLLREISDEYTLSGQTGFVTADFQV